MRHIDQLSYKGDRYDVRLSRHATKAFVKCKLILTWCLICMPRFAHESAHKDYGNF